MKIRPLGERVLIELVKEIRNIERDKKNYELSDLIRDRLNSLGINIEDNK